MRNIIYVILIAIGLAILGMFFIHNVHRNICNSILNSVVIDKEGLMSPTIKGDLSLNKLYIYHRGSRRLNQDTITRWKRLSGVVNVDETDYCVEITRSPNFDWLEIFHPELYIPGWEWKKD